MTTTGSNVILIIFLSYEKNHGKFSILVYNARKKKTLLGKEKDRGCLAVLHHDWVLTGQ